jgi:hypothetical protein
MCHVKILSRSDAKLGNQGANARNLHIAGGNHKNKKNITGGKTKHAYSAESKDPFTPS